ncbi:hypothetical protein [Novacetimonas hansenii]|uniref:hypothetical protein n=1 Tax=Novacetimonas hansenii TaxID=436 RepID=UPI0039EC15F6
MDFQTSLRPEELHMAGGRVEFTDVGAHVLKIRVVLPGDGTQQISANEKSNIAMVEMVISALWALGCRCHVETRTDGSPPTVHWVMPANF